jgi:GNAT superfamily N-acetyltransferase
VKVRIVKVAAESFGLYAEAIARALSEIYSESPLAPDRRGRIDAALFAHSGDPALLLLAAEASGSPAGSPPVSLLLAVPREDALLGERDAWLRVLFTEPAFRQRGIAASLLRQAEEILAARGVRALVVDALYGDDAIVGLFERRGYMRGRMLLSHVFGG